MIKNIRHSGIVVKSIGKALHFYVDLLGFEVVKNQIVEQHFGERILDIPKTKLVYIKLAIQDPNRSSFKSLLELYHFTLPHRIGSINKRIYKSYGGFNHISMTVADVDALYTKLRKARIKFYSKPTVDPEGKNKICFCRDYDGNMLELVEEICQTA